MLFLQQQSWLLQLHYLILHHLKHFSHQKLGPLTYMINIKENLQRWQYICKWWSTYCKYYEYVPHPRQGTMSKDPAHKTFKAKWRIITFPFSDHTDYVHATTDHPPYSSRLRKEFLWRGKIIGFAIENHTHLWGTKVWEKPNGLVFSCVQETKKCCLQFQI